MASDKENIVPAEILDLLRFICEAWSKVDEFVYKYCDDNALLHYPVIQGTSNQMRLQQIGQQPYSKANLQKAIQWMQLHRVESNGEV